MGTIISLGGGRYDNGEIINVFKKIRRFSDKKNPKVIFLPTAGFDDITGDEVILKSFEHFGCSAEPLFLTDSSLSYNFIRDKILSADIIYAGGGNLEFMMDTFKKTKADKILKEAYEKGIILSGLSAGAMCWYSEGWDDCGENGTYKFVDCIGILPYCICPHFDSYSWGKFEYAAKDAKYSSIALDNGAAMIYSDGKFSFMNGNDGGSVYFFDKEKNFEKRTLHDGSAHQTVILDRHKTRFIKIYSKNDPAVPENLFKKSGYSHIFEHRDFKYPLPFDETEIKLEVQSGNVLWMAGPCGLVRYCEDEPYEYDRCMYFSAKRDMPDNDVLSLIADENSAWVETASGVSKIELKEISMKEKSDILRSEALRYLDRFGMISSRRLKKEYDLDSFIKQNDCDNDGGFTASFCIGEICRYETLRRTKGENCPETIDAYKAAVRMIEACLLLMYISGRNDGFVARTYLVTGDKVPDDGLFLRKKKGKAVVEDTTFARSIGVNGMECDASSPVPERLKHLYTDEGYSDDDIIFKGDTSSDEITLHFVNLWFAKKYIAPHDKELNDIIDDAVYKLMSHIIENNFELVDFHGRSTTWAKWSTDYFKEGLGWADAPLNAAEAMLYLKITIDILGSDEKWTSAYNGLIEKGYPDLTTLHYDRAFGMGIYNRLDPIEDIMYGDHMLANLSFFGLLYLEKDEKLREKFRKGWESWRRYSIKREHHPIYDIPYMTVTKFDVSEINIKKLEEWFYRYGSSELAAVPSMNDRKDVCIKVWRGGYLETGVLLPNDERKITKYDKNPFEIDPERVNTGTKYIESCSQYTTSYWLGRLTGVIEDIGED